MNTFKIWDDDNKGFLRIIEDNNYEKITPGEYKKRITEAKAILLKDLITVKYPELAAANRPEFYTEQADLHLKDFWAKIFNSPTPHNIINALGEKKKKRQISLLKKGAITTEQLTNLIFQVYDKYGYLYSKYHFEIPAKKIDPSMIPKAAYITEYGKVHTIGNKGLTEGQIKEMINHRKVIVAHFFENNEAWHLLLGTYNGFKGEENWNGGQSHLHYLSSAFNLTKEHCLKVMEEGNYPSTKVHIALTNYGKQIK